MGGGGRGEGREVWVDILHLDCAVHVFRVVLSSKPSDNTTEAVNRDK